MGISHSTQAQDKAVRHARAEARIIDPMTIHQCSDLKFDNVTGSGGTVAVASAAGNTSTYTTTANLKPGGKTGIASAATFCVSGETGFACTIAPRTNKVIVTGPTCGSCTNTLSVSLADPSSGPTLTIPSGDATYNEAGVTGGSGTICYYVGGTLAIPKATNLEMGVYTGTWSETVAY